ncbi:MAG: hypothetical protein RSD70_02300 [Acidaminococcaceae bacterium]
MQEADAAFSTIGSLDFDSEPLIIEWKREDKENVMCGSNATLKIISPGDRTYEDMYSIEVGRIRMDVYKENALYWSGSLDPEFYEEPYEQAKGYVVQLAFSDFGILDRIKYDLSGLRTLREIVEYAIQRAGIHYGGIDANHVTTQFPGGATIANGALSVRSENFIDEDGEASTMEEVIEGILQPLALRIIQRQGKVYIYDLNGLYTKGIARVIQWDGESQTMGADKVANNVIVSFSPYSSSELIDGELEYGGKYDVKYTNLTGDSPGSTEYGDYFSYYPDYSEDHRLGYDWDYNLIDFTIFTHGKGNGLAGIFSGCKYFHLLPVTGGVSECSGVAYAFRTGGHGGINTGWPKWKVHSSVPRPNRIPILRTNRVFIPKLDDESMKKYKVRLVEEIVIDARYNPFSGSTNGNDEGNDHTVKVCSGFVFVPAKVTLYDANGKALYHYSNKEAAVGATVGHLGYSKGKWISGEDPGGDCWLEYYKPEDLGEDAGIRGWTSNRHCVGRPDGKGGRINTKIYDSFKKMAAGEYMTYPPAAGYLEIEIQAGVYGYDYGQKVDNCEFGSGSSQWDAKGIYKLLRWNLYKAPKVDIVNNNLVFNAAELEDIEYSGYVNKSAKEEISIDTICGTTTQVCPTAKGIYHQTDTGLQIEKLKRAGRTDHPEKLLIGTLYSQYADRKTTLSGEAVIDAGLHYYTEQNQDGKRFMLMCDVQNVITDCTDAEYCEFKPDEYDSIEEVK